MTSPIALRNLTTVIILLPLIGSIISGIFGKYVGRRGAHWITCGFMFLSFVLAVITAKFVLIDQVVFQGAIYHWVVSGGYTFDIGLLIDHLSVIMILIVTFISFLVHVYSIGYMKDDGGYQRFFSYISLFTFAMLILVTANNFMQLYLGWEGVGLVSYLLIGFWFKRESANQGSLKAFLVNRVGDLGFILGIGAITIYFGTVNYDQVFAKAIDFTQTSISLLPGTHVSLITLICVLLFIGAMGKSAQMPLHVWLPESMEGPTPISALIHAATMVTAGVYLLCRMSPLFELSNFALSLVLIIGATTALFTGILALVQHDIKRIIAYSTLSQLGYMVAAAGASAYSAAMFHLLTHACFKALLFLAAGSVIIAMHHEQDIRKMGGLRKYMPITYICFLIGALALSAVPPFSGFYSKDSIIDAIKFATIPGASYAYYCVLFGAFITALYTFRAFFLTFHTKPRFEEQVVKESPWIICLPLIILAVPSVVLGWLAMKPILFDEPGLLGGSLYVAIIHPGVSVLVDNLSNARNMFLDAYRNLSFWLAIAGIFSAWFSYVACPKLPQWLARRGKVIHWVLIHKYGFDYFNQVFFVAGTQRVANYLFQVGDVKLIDDSFVNGSGKLFRRLSTKISKLQTGYIYHYLLAIFSAIVVLLTWFLIRDVI